jgi:hypothetical protein
MVPELLIGYQAVGLSEGRGSMSRKLATLCSIGLFAVATGVAHAATVETFDLTQDGFGVTGQTFAVVTLTQSVTGTVQVQEVLSSGIDFVKTGAGDSLAFNIAGLTPTQLATDITFTGSSVGEYTVSTSNDNKNSPFGDFLDAIECIQCGPGASTTYPGPVNFTINDPGLTLSDFTAVGGAVFASDIIDKNTYVDRKHPTGVVGGILTSTMTVVPEPSSLLLLGTGILGLAGVVRRRLMA